MHNSYFLQLKSWLDLETVSKYIQYLCVLFLSVSFCFSLLLRLFIKHCRHWFVICKIEQFGHELFIFFSCKKYVLCMARCLTCFYCIHMNLILFTNKIKSCVLLCIPIQYHHYLWSKHNNLIRWFNECVNPCNWFVPTPGNR